jgi:type IV pilus assembly protein PilC
MAKFTYVAVGADGKTATGIHEAANRAAAETVLYGSGLRNIRLTEKTGLLKMELTAPRVKREEIMHLSRQLGAFVRAGLPIIEAVHVLGDEAKNSAVRRMMADVEDGLRRGEKLSDCFNRHPKIFPEFYRGILRSAELTGQLDVVLDQLARYLERDLEARRKIKSALIYPMVISVMSLTTVVIMATWVLPRFKVFFAGLHAQLPWPTRALLAGHRLLRKLVVGGPRRRGGSLVDSVRLPAYPKRPPHPGSVRAAHPGDRAHDSLRARRTVLPGLVVDGRGRCRVARGATRGQGVVA